MSVVCVCVVRGMCCYVCISCRVAACVSFKDCRPCVCGTWDVLLRLYLVPRCSVCQLQGLSAVCVWYVGCVVTFVSRVALQRVSASRTVGRVCVVRGMCCYVCILCRVAACVSFKDCRPCVCGTWDVLLRLYLVPRCSVCQHQGLSAVCVWYVGCVVTFVSRAALQRVSASRTVGRVCVVRGMCCYVCISCRVAACVSIKDCRPCLEANISFQCSWCRRLALCSSGTDRNRQAWRSNGCHKEVRGSVVHDLRTGFCC